MLPLGAGLVCCEEMVAVWRQGDGGSRVGEREPGTSPLPPHGLHPRVRTIFARGHMDN
jgi:hypothetical protein